MNDLAYAIKQCNIISYVDDTVTIHCSNEDVSAVETILNNDFDNATMWFVQNGMKPNQDKYQAMVLGNTREELHFKAANTDIETTAKTNLLGVVLDNNLKFDTHISVLCRKISAQISALNRLKNILPIKTKELLYRSFILPQFYYCNQFGTNVEKGKYY